MCTECVVYIVQGTRCHKYTIQDTEYQIEIIHGTRCHV